MADVLQRTSLASPAPPSDKRAQTTRKATSPAHGATLRKPHDRYSGSPAVLQWTALQVRTAGRRQKTRLRRACQSPWACLLPPHQRPRGRGRAGRRRATGRRPRSVVEALVSSTFRGGAVGSRVSESGLPARTRTGPDPVQNLLLQARRDWSVKRLELQKQSAAQLSRARRELTAAAWTGRRPAAAGGAEAAEGARAEVGFHHPLSQTPPRGGAGSRRTELELLAAGSRKVPKPESEQALPAGAPLPSGSEARHPAELVGQQDAQGEPLPD